MKKAPLILFVGGALVAIGMVLLGISSVFIEQETIKKSGTVKDGSPLELITELDPQVGKGDGYFVILAQEYENAELKATVLDSVGNTITTLEIDRAATQQQFKIESKGEYKLILESGKSTEIMAEIALSYYPTVLAALSILGGSMIFSGFIGVAIAIIYAVISRKKV